MKENINSNSIIGRAAAPSVMYIARKNDKPTLIQRFQRLVHKIKRAYVIKTLKAESHTMDEVMKYITEKHGFMELSKYETETESKLLRASLILEHAPELLGKYAASPELKSESKEDIEIYLEQHEERMQKAMEIPTEIFDIDFHKFRKKDNKNNTIEITIEKKFSKIEFSAHGMKMNRGFNRKFNRIIKDIKRYYGVTKEYIETKSMRYIELVKNLCR